MYTALTCSVKLLSILLCWLTTKRSAPRRGAVSTNCVHVQYDLSMNTAFRAVSQNGLNLRFRIQ